MEEKMNISPGDWKEGLVSGVLAGAVWGWTALIVNRLTGAFPFEESLLHEVVLFVIGGAVFGVVVSGFMVLTSDVLPFKRLLPKAILLSTVLWLLMRTAGVALSVMDPLRYHPEMEQALQGFVLALIMGCLIGLFSKKRLTAV